jgi:hypothetical protein
MNNAYDTSATLAESDADQVIEESDSPRGSQNQERIANTRGMHLSVASHHSWRVATWEWQEGLTRWRSFDDDTAAVLEAAHQESLVLIELTTGYFRTRAGHLVDLENLLQHAPDGTVRPVRRRRLWRMHEDELSIQPSQSENNKADTTETLEHIRAEAAASFWNRPVDFMDVPADECSLCLVDLHGSDSVALDATGGDHTNVVRLSKCKEHYFHEECITKCIKISRPHLSCPICGTDYSLPNFK